MMPTAPQAATTTPPKPQSLRPTRARHVVLALTVAVYMITYMDRTIIASAMPLIRKEFGFSLITVGWILASFRWGFTLFQLPSAWFGDKIGPRRALAIIVTWWSVFTSLTTFAWSAASMVAIRFIFGVGANRARSPFLLDRCLAGCSLLMNVVSRKALRTPVRDWAPPSPRRSSSG